VPVDSIKPKLKPPGTKRLKLKCDIPLSTSAFKFNLRRYIKFQSGRCDVGGFFEPRARGAVPNPAEAAMYKKMYKVRW